MTRVPRAAGSLPVLSGVLLALSFPPARLLVPVFVALVPLLLFIASRPDDPGGRWSATRGGIVTGVVYFGLQLYWIAVALIRYSVLAIPAYLGMVAVLAGLTGAFAWAIHFTRQRPGVQLPLAVTVAVFWTMLEWTQAHLGDLAFPWLGLGTALAPFPTLAGAADLVGARGLTFWIAGVNGLIASIVLAPRPRRARVRARELATLGAVLAVPMVYGVVRSATLETRPVARVAIVQPNIPEDVKLGPAGLDSSLVALRSLTLSLEGTRLDLVAWPEVALPEDFLRSDRLRLTAHGLSERVGAPILVGAYGVDRHDRPTTYNSAFLVDGRRPVDAVADRYDKRRLVPFIERIPFIDPRLLTGGRDDARFGALERGRERPAMAVPGGGAFGVLICYESTFAPLARSYRAAGADYLVNITNDAWYGRPEWWGRTPALWQHPAHMVLRAIETRTGVVRAANTGISMFIDPLGRTDHETPLFEAGVAVGTVRTTHGVSGFVRWGDWVGALAVLFGVMVLVLDDRTIRSLRDLGRR